MKVSGVGHCLPPTNISSESLERSLGLEAGWIVKRTGIISRPIADDEQATSDLAVAAVENALDNSRVERSDIGLVLLATSTPDHLLPPSAPLVASRLGLTRAGAVDLGGACSGFLYALVLAASHCEAIGRPVIVIGANVLSRRLRAQDPRTVPVFADGAGALILEPSAPSDLLGHSLGADGRYYGLIGIPQGGSRSSLTPAGLRDGMHQMHMHDGRSLFRHAVLAMAQAGNDALADANLKIQDIDLFVPHQANVRMIEETARLIGIGAARTACVTQDIGNSSAATIPIALSLAIKSGRISFGDRILLVSAGAGMTSAGVVLNWGLRSERPHRLDDYQGMGETMSKAMEVRRGSLGNVDAPCLGMDLNQHGL